MANTPSLGEILSINTKAAGGLAPSVPLDNRQLLQTLNENSKFQAEMAWKKYNVFQEQLGNLFQNLQDISGLEVLPQDRGKLDSDRKQLLDSIWQSPKEFFGSGNMKRRAEIEGKLSQYKRDATQSKQDAVIHQAHQKLLEATPELNTDENRKIVDEYVNQPFGARKLPSLVMPTVFDPSVVLKGIFGPQGISTRVSPYAEKKDGMIIQGSTTTNDYALAMNSWMGALYSPDKYGQSHYKWAESQFNSLTPEQKGYYQKQVGDDKTKQIEAFWKDYGEQQMGFRANAINEWNRLSQNEKSKYKDFEDYFSQNPDIIRKETQTMKPDPYEEMSLRFAEQEKLLDKRIAASFALAENRQANSEKRAEAKGIYMNLLPIKLIKEAQANGKPFVGVGGTGKLIGAATGSNSDEREAPWASKYMNLFAKTTTNTLGKTVKEQPKNITVDKGGNIYAYFKNGDKETYSPDQFKDLLGGKASGALEASAESLLRTTGSTFLGDMDNMDNYLNSIIGEDSGDKKKPTKKVKEDPLNLFK